MQLAMWTYEGPPHVGAMRVATAMRGLHYVLHAPQGDTYADLLFTMIERRPQRTPVTYTTFQARDLGGDTAEKLKLAIRDAHERFRPEAMIVGASCTAELIQDDPGGLAAAVGLPIPVVALELPAYSKKENWGAAETFYRLVRALAGPAVEARRRGATSPTPSPLAGEGKGEGASQDESPASTHAETPPHPTSAFGSGHLLPRGEKGKSCNILGPTALGFRHRDDVAEIRGLLERLGVSVNVVAPLGASPADLARLGEADFNVVLYPEIALTAANWLKREFDQPFTTVVPIGVGATRAFVEEVASLAGLDPSPILSDERTRLPWWSRSVDSNYLTGKRVFIFGDATHAIATARVASKELGFKVVGIGAYSREFAREVRAKAEELGLEALVTDDHMEVERAIAALQPELVLGTQMERHIAKRLGVPCAVISAPVHVQDFPARTSPVMGFEGANVLFDTLVHPLMMGLEEHLVAMFRDDFEFADGALPSHLATAGHAEPAAPLAQAAPDASILWEAAAEQELKKIPFFVRGKARRNTESFARQSGIAEITVETLYDAKAHFGR